MTFSNRARPPYQACGEYMRREGAQGQKTRWAGGVTARGFCMALAQMSYRFATRGRHQVYCFLSPLGGDTGPLPGSAAPCQPLQRLTRQCKCTRRATHPSPETIRRGAGEILPFFRSSSLSGHLPDRQGRCWPTARVPSASKQLCRLARGTGRADCWSERVPLRGGWPSRVLGGRWCGLVMRRTERRR